MEQEKIHTIDRILDKVIKGDIQEIGAKLMFIREGITQKDLEEYDELQKKRINIKH